MTIPKISIHKRNVKKRLKGLKERKNISEKEVIAIKEFIRKASLGQINKGKKIEEARLQKYLDMLIVPLNYFKKDLDTLTLKDMEGFIQDLDKNKIKTKTKKSYSDNSKNDIKRILKIYLKYRIKDTIEFNKLTDWIDLRDKKRTPEYLKEEDIIKLYNSCKTAKHRFLIAVLFDTGARAEEFFNIRMGDITEPDTNFPYYKINLKEEYSKTKGRNIGLYWKHSTGAVRDYMKEISGRHRDKPVYSDTYDSARLFINRLGKKILKRRVYFHLFRHSSATHYAKILKNRQQLCYRFGWQFSSEMPDVYISRAGMEEQEVGEKIKATEIEELRKRIDQLEQMMYNVIEIGKGTIKKAKEKYKVKL